MAGTSDVAGQPGDPAVDLTPQLGQAHVAQLGGRVAGCSAVELPTEGELKATRGEAGFHIGIVG